MKEMDRSRVLIHEVRWMTATARMQLRWTGARSAASVALRSHAFRLALAIVNDRDLAEDIAQEAMIKLHQNPGVVAPEAWLRRVVTNLALNALRSQREVSLELDRPAPDPGHEERMQVERTLQRLSPEQRVVLALALGEGLTYLEIAETLEIPEGTVASRLAAAKDAFRKEWDR